MIPLMEGEKPGSVETAQINGHKYTLKKGTMVEVPEPVAKLLANKYKVELDAAKRSLAFGDERKRDALTGS